MTNNLQDLYILRTVIDELPIEKWADPWEKIELSQAITEKIQIKEQAKPQMEAFDRWIDTFTRPERFDF